MKNLLKVIILLFFAVDILLLFFIILYGQNIALFNPKGMIALKERNLFFTGVFLGFSIIIPSFILTFFIVLKYRAGNIKATYAPEWSGNTFMKFALWAIPAFVVVVLATITWGATHALDPYKPLMYPIKPLTIQVVALDWKWLFIYPEQHIATVNFIEFPANTPINFLLTADAPMNSFWIPQLGGQMYAMAGMQTQLHLIADAPGEFMGSEVEINGSGFAGMRFTAQATTQAAFDAWAQSIHHSSPVLTSAGYTILSKPSEYNQPVFYALGDKHLYNEIITKYMMPISTHSQLQRTSNGSSDMMQGMNMQ